MYFNVWPSPKVKFYFDTWVWCLRSHGHLDTLKSILDGLVGSSLIFLQALLYIESTVILKNIYVYILFKVFCWKSPSLPILLKRKASVSIMPYTALHNLSSLVCLCWFLLLVSPCSICSKLASCNDIPDTLKWSKPVFCWPVSVIPLNNISCPLYSSSTI